ncbi:MAG: hypothetical protein PHD72_04450, partial [Patescibacteria group bacterium]|nr:hypothetical protein [Patescibacteria group bacterium]
MPPQPKKILFASLSAGAGHVRAAEALLATCHDKYPNVVAHHVDLAAYLGWLTKKTTISSYSFAARHVPSIYGEIYRQFNSQDSTKIIYILAKILKLDLYRVKRKIDELNPDIIVCTNFLAPAMLSHAIGHRPFDMILTDYDFNHVFISPN